MKSQGLTTAPVAQTLEEQFDTPVSVETTVSEDAVVETTPEAEEAIAVETTPETSEPAEEAVAVETTVSEDAVVETTSEVEKAIAVETAPETSEPAEEAVVVETAPATSEANPYSGKSQTELIALLSVMIGERAIQNLRADVEAVKIAFYKAGRVALETQHAAFLADGGVAEDFKPNENSAEAEFKALLIQYREKRDAFILNSEQAKERAYAEKRQIIEELKDLITGNETIGQTFNAFRELQQRWKDAGIVPQDKIKDLWDTYHHHVEIFYNYIKINKELRDLDLKKNYEAKTLLAEEAEALMLDTSATNSFNKLQKLHDQWREIGPVTAEFKDVLWDRFKIASTQINKRHQQHFEGVKEEQTKNLALKAELCQKVEELAVGEITTHKEWTVASEQIVEIQKVWKTIGFAPKKENTKIYEHFRLACDKFFDAKRMFYKGMKSEIEDNLQAKLDLCVQAEALQDSEDWKATTDALIGLQKKWKEIGATSRKHSEQIWKRFRTASDRFFAHKTEHFGSQDSQYAENLTQKQHMLDDMRAKLHDKVDLTFDVIKEYQRKWAEVGFVPIKKKESIYAEYRKVVDGLFDLLRGDEKERNFHSFRDKVSKIQDSGSRRLGQEREKLYNKIKQIESDIQIWENNIGFFSKSKNADALMKDVQNKIVRAKENIATMIEKVKMIDNPPPVEVKVKAAVVPVPEVEVPVVITPEVDTKEVEAKVEVAVEPKAEVKIKKAVKTKVEDEVEVDKKTVKAKAKAKVKVEVDPKAEVKIKKAVKAKVVQTPVVEVEIKEVEADTVIMAKKE